MPPEMSSTAPQFLPFWALNYGLALVMWLCLGRFLLSFFIARQPNNYIWRSFRFLTEWAVVAASFVTPRYIHPVLLPPIAALWIFYLRLLVFALFHQAGLTPPVEPS
jgi:hypothetical protein